MTTADRRFQLCVLPRHFKLARLAPNAAIPHWAQQGPFFSITRTADELSVVAESRNIPQRSVPSEPQTPGVPSRSPQPEELQVESSGDWRVLKLLGPFALSEIGVLRALVEPLADAKISVFVISTFDTDYLLVSSEQLGAAVVSLRAAGYAVESAEF